MQIRGHVESCDESLIEGWVTLTEDPEAKVALEFLLDGEVIGRCVADQFRQDLKDANLGDGNCAFAFATPPSIAHSEINRISVRLQDCDVFLPVGVANPDSADAPTGLETVSRFGGLWIDRHDWIDRLAAKHRAGEISDALSVELFRFVRDGYLIIDRAISPALVDQVNTEIDRAWNSPPRGLTIETFEPDGVIHEIAPDVRLRAGRTKILDLYAHSSVVRRAIAAPRVIEFLAAVFEDKPKAFQGLTFWTGSEQAIHKDTAYVKIDGNPMHLAASWLALEDVQHGSGELEYYVGSHRAPDFLFGGVSKWMENGADEHERFLESLHEDAQALGHVRDSFLAKKGDVLIWHADLAHGGAAISHSARTRKSLVTHFTASADEPFYRRKTQHKVSELSGCQFVSEYADIGRP